MVGTRLEELSSWQYRAAPGIPERCDQLYREFMALFINSLPEAIQGQLSFHFEQEESSRADDGFFHRPDDGKWVGHVRPWTWADRQLPCILFSQASLIIKAIGLKRFLKWHHQLLVWHHRVVELCEDIYRIVEDFAAEVDEVHPEFNLVANLRDPKARRKHLMRFVHYLPKQPGEVMASPHRDFSLITADCLTTSPGLCTTDQDHSLVGKKLIPEKLQHIILFPGRKMEEVTKGAVPGLCHGVVSTAPDGSEAIGRELTRGAVIFFAHGPGKMGASCPS